MAPGMKRVRQLDPKLCFELWMRTGSVYKVAEVLMNEYQQYNVKTGRKYSHMGIWQASNAWMLDNLPEARKMVEEVYRANGVLLTDQLWYTLVMEKAVHLHAKRFKAFMEQHSYLKPYLKSDTVSK